MIVALPGLFFYDFSFFFFFFFFFFLSNNSENVVKNVENTINATLRDRQLK